MIFPIHTDILNSRLISAHPFKDNPNEDKPEYLTSWRNVRLSKKEISEWPECISSIIDLGKILKLLYCIKTSNCSLAFNHQSTILKSMYSKRQRVY